MGAIAELARDIAGGRVPTTRPISQSIEACQRVGRDLNAFVRIDARAAMDAARQADARFGREPSVLPLQGVSLAYKDMFYRQGYACSFGSRISQSADARFTASCIARVEAAGGIFVGALNMSEFALGPTGHNATFGHCRNPWNPMYVSGGSSSGAGAAVAAGIVHGALGSDTGGSIRIPAACCGVVGLKPTQDRVSAAGAMPLASSLDCIGPLARTVEDCELLFDVIDTAAAAARTCSNEEAARVRRIVYPRALVAKEVEEDIVAALDGAAAVLRELGFKIIEREMPDISQLHDLADAVQKPESAAVHAKLLREHRLKYTRHIRRRIEPGFFVAAPAYIHALQQRPVHTRRFECSTLAGADALLLPTLGMPVPTIAQTDEESLGPLPQLVGRMTRWTRWINYLGVPALSVPCGVDRNAMPVGMQLVGVQFGEAMLLEIGKRYQAATHWHLRTPPWSASTFCL